MGAIALSLKDAHFERHEMQQFLEMDEMRQNKNMAIPVIKSKENRFYLLSGHIQASKSYFRITISDTGQGIFPEVLPNVLDPFFTTKNRDKPAGLGLSSVHGTVLSYDGAIIVESESRNTVENAKFSGNILKERGDCKNVLLITSALHMPRSKFIFDKAGIKVEAYPVDFFVLRGRPKKFSLREFIVPRSNVPGIWEAIIHEWVGLLSARFQ